MKTTALIFICFFSFGNYAFSQVVIPSIYTNITVDGKGTLKYNNGTAYFNAFYTPPDFKINNFNISPVGTATGIDFDFKLSSFNGVLYYGLISYEDSKFPLPVFFKNPEKIVNGKASIDIKKNLSGVYDMIYWGKNMKGTIGYRIADNTGKLIYEGRVAFKGNGPFEVVPTITEGPFINKLSETGCVISFKSSKAIIGSIKIDIKVGDKVKTLEFSDAMATFDHEIEIKGLNSETEYIYKTICGSDIQSYSFKTAPKIGSRKPFSFAYSSDCRNAQGGGERNLYGTNYYMVKKMMALSSSKNVSFLQFTGDMVNGYCLDKNDIELQYANWKRAIETFAHYFPVYVGMGNHESVVHMFPDDESGIRYMIDKFPFATESSEALFASNFVCPENGPVSEDGSAYDPDNKAIDYPLYKENVYYYTYDNVAMVVLNSDYWYSPTLLLSPNTSGNLHGYVMDNQFAWLKETIKKLESDTKIDHVFITIHTPFFPNGGHVDDDMWYDGNNLPRAVVAGVAVKSGIIERRDQMLDLFANQSTKVIAILTGDEHNYNRLELNSDVNIYPNDWELPKIMFKRKIYQINNGAAGAPYYAQQETPWSINVKGFTTQNALVFFYIDGQKVRMEVINPDTLEKFDELILKE